MDTNTYLIHISDIHYRKDWEESQEKVLKAFFKDLEYQVKQFEVKNALLILSGDVVLAGSENELYKSFLEHFGKELDSIGITKEKRLCIPGNHDVARKFVENHFVEHNGIIVQNLNEKSFNDYISKNTSPLIEKFDNYTKFEKQFSNFGVDINTSGRGWDFNDKIGFYCLNTALTSSGGCNNINDFGKLSIDTRSINKWVGESKAAVKVLVMHHPYEWLVDWAKTELKDLIKNNFKLVFSGHVHSQEMFHSIQQNGALVECSAPPLFTNKTESLGYTIISLNNLGIEEIIYRQWTGKGAFVRGVNFSNNEEGKIIINSKASEVNKVTPSSDNLTETSFLLKQRLNDALRAFSNQPVVWIDPLISKVEYSTMTNTVKDEDKVAVEEILENSNSIIFKAPPQFGLTCLANFIAKCGWDNKQKLWLYIDFRELKLYNVEKIIANELKLLNVSKSELNCIMLDCWNANEKDSIKILNKVQTIYPNIRIFCFCAIDDSNFGIVIDESRLDNFDVLYLLPLPRNQIRKVINEYNQLSHIGDEDLLLDKVTTDLEVLNIHRTPLNRLTLLKVLENNFDSSPINRSELERVDI